MTGHTALRDGFCRMWLCVASGAGCTSEAEVRGLAAGDPRAPRHVLRALADLPLA